MISSRSKSNQTTENVAPGSAVCVDENSLNEVNSKPFGNMDSSPYAGHSPNRINENFCGETQSGCSSNTSCGIHTNSETGEVEASVIPSPDSGSKDTSCESKCKEMRLNSSQITISEDLRTSSNESQCKKCSGECDELLCCHLNPKQECDIDCDMKVKPLIVARDKNNFILKEPQCTNIEKVPSYHIKCVDEDEDNVIEKPKKQRPLYNPYWLEPDPDDFKLVADSVEGVRKLLTTYCDDDDLVLIERFSKKVRKFCCLFNLFHDIPQSVTVIIQLH
jgi:hypothetical protein